METISLIISIAVIIGMTASFSILFTIYVKYKLKHILYGHEDSNLKQEVCSEYQKHTDKYKDVFDFLQKKLKKEHKYQILIDTFFGVIITCILALGVCATIYRVNGNQVFINNTTYLVIRTGSMETKNPNHQNYDSLPDNQIKTFSLVGIDKVESEEDLKLFDVVAFENRDIVYVHRIVNIRVEDGTTYYTTQGDANTGSFTFESNLKFEQIIGKYNGYNNLWLGFMAFYFSSNIGIIAWTFSLLFILIVDLSEVKIDKMYRKRMLYVAEHCKNEAIEQQEHVIRYNRSFMSKLMQSADPIKEWYSDIKNTLLTYKGVHSHISWKKESFRYKRKLLAQFLIRGKALCLILIANEKKDHIEYETFKIKSNRKHLSIMKLIEERLTAMNVKIYAFEPKDWYYPYENDVVLLKKSLIKRKIVTLKEANFYEKFTKNVSKKEDNGKNDEVVDNG